MKFIPIDRNSIIDSETLKKDYFNEFSDSQEIHLLENEKLLPVFRYENIKLTCINCDKPFNPNQFMETADCFYACPHCEFDNSHDIVFEKIETIQSERCDKSIVDLLYNSVNFINTEKYTLDKLTVYKACIKQYKTVYDIVIQKGKYDNLETTDFSVKVNNEFPVLLIHFITNDKVNSIISKVIEINSSESCLVEFKNTMKTLNKFKTKKQ